VSNPTSPGEPIYKDTSGEARGVYVKDNYAYIADEYFGLAIINVSNPTSPGEPIYTDISGNAYDVYVKDDYIYIVSGDALKIFKDTSGVTERKKMAKRKVLAQNYPNPFNPECYIPVGRIENEARRAKVKIYNILGQLVREIEISDLKSQISKSVYWDGRDSRGLEVPAGIYFYEVAGEVVKRMVVLK
jgi:hypothetical protein